MHTTFLQSLLEQLWRDCDCCWQILDWSVDKTLRCRKSYRHCRFLSILHSTHHYMWGKTKPQIAVLNAYSRINVYYYIDDHHTALASFSGHKGGEKALFSSHMTWERGYTATCKVLNPYLPGWLYKVWKRSTQMCVITSVLHTTFILYFITVLLNNNSA